MVARMPLTQAERASFRQRFNHLAVAVIQGELLEITYVTHDKAHRVPGRRGSVKGFSAAARLRMLRTISTVDWDQVGNSLFITLTYPDTRFDRTIQDRTRDRYLFFRDMENYLGKEFGALWRIEWKPRKTGKKKGTMVPHVHVIVFDVGFLPWQTIRNSWRRVLAVDGHLSTDVRRIRGGKSVAMYVSKYCSKPMDVNRSLDIASYLNTGRHWGIHRRNLIPWADRVVNHHLTKQDIQLCENAAAMTFPYFVRDAREGFSLFGERARKVIYEILRLDVDEAFEKAYDAKVERGS
jgi:hypothetical protein